MKNNDRIKILARAIYSATQDKSAAESKMVVDNFIIYLKKHYLTNLISGLLNELETIYLADQDTVAVAVFSKDKLNSQAAKEISQLVSRKIQKKVLLRESIDPDIMGGVKIKYEDKIIDLTLNNHLINLAKQLSS